LKNRDGHDRDTKFFIGTEVEHTPAYGQRTLFVVGLQNLKEILARALNNDCPHIYLGANQSFKPESDGEWEEWNFIIEGIVSHNIWVTLDYDIKYHEEILEESWVEKNTFISMISVKLPYINQLNYNACIKIDDKGYNETNAGVWVHKAHDLQDRSKFTDWTKYTKDEIIE
tara:strand:- start:1522 stop:2034 length:513 start_codon:yes stop_codon:yes gene_type:complete